MELATYRASANHLKLALNTSAKKLKKALEGRQAAIDESQASSSKGKGKGKGKNAAGASQVAAAKETRNRKQHGKVV